MPPSGTSISTASIPYLKTGRNIGYGCDAIPMPPVHKGRNLWTFASRDSPV
jgi:hypothetical protein